METLTQQIQEQLKLVETVQQNAESEVPVKEPTVASTALSHPRKITKPPKFLPFSGSDPPQKGECGIETLLFQVKGARKDVADYAVRTALISCLRGSASSFVEYLGLDTPLDAMIEELRERYSKVVPVDTLVCEFHQTRQDRNETVKGFAGRIEQLFKQLQDQVPDRYPDQNMLRDRLFYGMNPELKSSLRYLFARPGMTYSELLQAAYAAELENRKPKGPGSTIRAAAVEMVYEDPPLSAVGSKIDQLTTIVKSVKTQSTKDPRDKSRKDNTWGTITLSKGPAPSSAGPFRGQKKAVQCWNCGGWGHTSRGCPSQGNVQWRELSGMVDPPLAGTFSPVPAPKK